MRLSVLAALAVVLSISMPAFAQEYVEYKSAQDRFGATFPTAPRVTQTTFTSQFGSVLPMRLYESDSGSSHFRVTVVDYSNIEAIATEKAKSCPAGAETCRGGGSSTGIGYWKADINGAIHYATWGFMQRDAKITYMGWNNIDLVEGTMLYMTNAADQSRTSAGIYMHENKLYVLEGTVPKGYPDPGFFQQSVQWLDETGSQIRYTTLYHNGFPRPEIARRGGGAAVPAQAPRAPSPR